MQLISKYNEWIRFLLCVIDTLSKYAWVFPLRDKEDITITNAYQTRYGQIKLMNFAIDQWNCGYKTMK